MANLLSLTGWLGLFKRRELTPEERAELAAQRAQRDALKLLKDKLAQEAEAYADLIKYKLKDLGVCYRYRKSEKGMERYKLVRFARPFVLREEAIYLEVNLHPGQCPPGVGVGQLADEETLKNLSMACGRKVLARYTPETGFWYIVEREYGVRGIPSHVKYDEILSLRPASADGLSLPLGIGENKKPVWRSLGQMYSMLIAGTVGGGKSNFINALICTLLRYNSPNRLKFMLVDLKGGVEFSYYQGIPHLLTLPNGEGERKPAIIEKRDDVPEALRWIVNEGERRLGLLKEKRKKNVGQFNYQNRNPIPHLVVVIDEWADVKLDRDTGREAEELLINIASRFRAAGIHVILCTQVPNKDVVSIRIKNVLPARIAFACPDIHASMLIIGDGKAAGLEPAGRAIFDWGHSQFELQSPYINNQTVDSVVDQAIGGKFNELESTVHDVTDQEVYEWALNENGGSLAYNAIFAHFRGRGFSLDLVKAWCKEQENKEVIIADTVYRVAPPPARGQPRRLLPVEEAEVTDTGAVASGEEQTPQSHTPTPDPTPTESENVQTN